MFPSAWATTKRPSLCGTHAIAVHRLHQTRTKYQEPYKKDRIQRKVQNVKGKWWGILQSIKICNFKNFFHSALHKTSFIFIFTSKITYYLWIHLYCNVLAQKASFQGLAAAASMTQNILKKKEHFGCLLLSWTINSSLIMF